MVKGFSDADFANDQETRKSSSGYVFFISNGAVTWTSRKQSVVALSTAEAEYISAASAAQEALWLRYLLLDIQESVRALAHCRFSIGR